MITLSQAQAMIATAKAKAEELKIAVSITVVDASGIQIASARMDNAIPISPEFSFVKAYSSAVVGIPTAVMAQYATPEKPYYGVNTILGGRLTLVAGGQPVMENGVCVGAIGVGGSMDVSQDDACATAGASITK